jgi:hypothetical protein
VFASFARVLFLAGGFTLSGLLAQGQANETHFLPQRKLSQAHFGNDHDWYDRNIPFFACADSTLEQVYYYRWELYKAHLKNLGSLGYIATEFLNEMSWDRKPYSSLNDATGFHLYEGRWLKDNRYVRDYITYLYQHGGNDRHFSEYIADATYANHLVNPDRAFVTAQLPAMRRSYQAWSDHYDTSKGLYYIEPLLDATEYTISSIDASNGKDGFRGGDAFRPSINSYQYANARAIARVAWLAGDTAAAGDYTRAATALKRAVQAKLWRPDFAHFIDRYQVSNDYVKYGEFIRGRELAGYVPWTFGLPDDTPGFNAAWTHLLDPKGFAGTYGLRTNEPSYEYYMRQYRYVEPAHERECQWNGPSWPFQTSQVLLGMANVLNTSAQPPIGTADYLRVLHQYAQQHYQGRTLNVVEDYDPDKGGPIVDLDQRSEHYNHSEFNDLIISGLCGLRPAAGDSVRIHPLVGAADALPYFCLENVRYHGHNLTVLYDRTGRQYRQGAGLSVYVDGKRTLAPAPLGTYTVALPPPTAPAYSSGLNVAVNLTGKGFPEASASYTGPQSSAQQAIDGRVWYFQDVRNRWSAAGSPTATDWYSVTFAQPQLLRQVVLHFYSNGKDLTPPKAYEVQYWTGTAWQPVRLSKRGPRQPLGNTATSVAFAPISTTKIRVLLTHAGAGHYAALTEVEAYE